MRAAIPAKFCQQFGEHPARTRDECDDEFNIAEYDGNGTRVVSSKNAVSTRRARCIRL